MYIGVLLLVALVLEGLSVGNGGVALLGDVVAVEKAALAWAFTKIWKVRSEVSESEPVSDVSSSS